MSLDGVAEVLSWVAWMIGAKAGLEATRERDRQRVVDELARRFSEKGPEGAESPAS